MTLSAVIFDLDGTVLANEDEYGEAFAQVLKELGVEVSPKYPQVGGIGVEENWSIFLKKYNIKTEKSIEELTKETQDVYLSMLDRVEIKAGFKKLVKGLKDSGIQTALATSNVRFIVEKDSDKKNLDGYFDVVTTGEEVKNKKPNPDLFLETAKKLGVESENCVVIEDSEAGVNAARNAGMKVVGMARDDTHERQLKKADLIIKDFTELSPEKIIQL